MPLMRWTRAALLLCAAATACRFSFVGVDTGAGDDMAVTPDDLATGGDMPPCACATGCSETPTHHCLALQPSGPVTAGDYGMAGLKAITVNINITINTDTGAITGPPAVMRAAGPGVVNGIGYHVVAQSGGPVGRRLLRRRLDGRQRLQDQRHRRTNAFALASAGAVEIDGVVDGSCSGMMPGPGGFAGGMRRCRRQRTDERRRQGGRRRGRRWVPLGRRRRRGTATRAARAASAQARRPTAACPGAT